MTSEFYQFPVDEMDIFRPLHDEFKNIDFCIFVLVYLFWYICFGIFAFILVKIPQKKRKTI